MKFGAVLEQRERLYRTRQQKAIRLGWASTRQAIRRGSFPSVRELTDAIKGFIDAWNEDSQPFVWTQTVDEILAKTNRQTEPLTDC